MEICPSCLFSSKTPVKAPPNPHSKTSRKKLAAAALRDPVSQEVEALGKEVVGKPEASWDSTQADVAWMGAKLRADLGPQSKMSAHPRLLERLIDPAATQHLTKRLAGWYDTLEVYMADLDGGLPPAVLHKPRRGQGWGSKWGKAPKSKVIGISWAEARASWAAKVAALLREVLALLKSGKARDQWLVRCDHLKGLAESMPVDFWRFQMGPGTWACVDLCSEGFSTFSPDKCCRALEQASCLSQPAVCCLSATLDAVAVKAGGKAVS